MITEDNKTQELITEFQDNLSSDIENILESYGVYSSDLDYDICKYVEEEVQELIENINTNDNIKEK